jgi:MFS family permease
METILNRGEVSVKVRSGGVTAETELPENPLAIPQPPIQAAPLPVEQPRAFRRFRTLEPLGHRNFGLFWSGALVSNVGTWLQNVAMSWLVLEITHSPFWVSMVTFCQFFPTLMFGLFGGLMADRLDRRRVLLVTQTVQMSLAFVLVAITWSGHASVATLLPVIGLSGVSMAFNAPAFQAIIPDLVPPRLIIDAVSLNSTQWSVARVFGPALGGLILGVYGAGWAFFSNGASFLAVIAALLMIRTEKHDPPTSTGARALFGGVRSARETPAIAMLLAATAVVSLFGAPVLVLLPVMARDVLGLHAEGFGGLFALFSVGAVFGALSTATIVRRFGMRTTMVGALVALAALIAGFGQSKSLALSIALLIGIGAVYTMSVSATSSGLQSSIPPKRRGRIMSLYMMAWGGLYPIGAVAAGYIATHVGAPKTLTMLTVPLTAAAIWLAVFGSSLTKVIPARR